MEAAAESGEHCFRTAASRFTSNAVSSPVAASPVAVEDKIFVAVPREPKHGKSTLKWALQNLAKDASRSRIIIAHVHVPAQMIPSAMKLGAIVPCSTMGPEELRASRQQERAKLEKKLHEYIQICRRVKVNCEKVSVQKDDIAEGILELIALHGIKKLVMGAAADKNYSKTMKAPTSKTALRIMDRAAPSCKIWFTCKEFLIVTRSQNSGCGSSANGDTASVSGTVVISDDPIEVGLGKHLSTHSSYDHTSSLSHQLDKTKEMVSEIEFLKREMHEEFVKRQNAERELQSASQKIKELDNSHTNELKKWRTLEESHARQRQEIERMTRQLDESYAALYNVNEQKLKLEQRISEIELYAKDNEDRLAANKYQLEMLQADYEKMQHERDAAIREGTELREMNQHGVWAPSEALNTKFSLIELQEATKSFDPLLKIGEGGFGSVHKGKQPQRIADVVEDAIEKGNLHSIIDTTAGSWPFVQANQLAHIGLRCSELRRKCRPDLTVDVWKVVEPLMKAASMTEKPLSCTTSTDDTCIPTYFICPILQEMMNDPYIAADGFTYEGEAIKGWLDSGHSTSPMTNLKLEHNQLVPNRALRSAILEWQQQ
ncbi:hypothetical protein PR202_gb14716 [Eleusine coracana subsp. coracana]|uniref:RING-type E3 ubiquitin transferase n=1 Tax=Eleusine coracana subsp. coracana TaxID=191504 RepID=A0AAV5ETN4_ELECO|nr:hypothetical protein PR202_gb14716 [Eleusine coracana subsp. coracana]